MAYLHALYLRLLAGQQLNCVQSRAVIHPTQVSASNLTIRIPDPIRDQLEQSASKLHLSSSQLAAEAIRAFCDALESCDYRLPWPPHVTVATEEQYRMILEIGLASRNKDILTPEQLNAWTMNEPSSPPSSTADLTDLQAADLALQEVSKPPSNKPRKPNRAK